MDTHIAKASCKKIQRCHDTPIGAKVVPAHKHTQNISTKINTCTVCSRSSIHTYAKVATTCCPMRSPTRFTTNLYTQCIYPYHCRPVNHWVLSINFYLFFFWGTLRVSIEWSFHRVSLQNAKAVTKPQYQRRKEWVQDSSYKYCTDYTRVFNNVPHTVYQKNHAQRNTGM